MDRKLEGRADVATRQRGDGARRGGVVKGAGALLAYVVVFVVLAWPWLRAANDSLPRSFGTPFVFADDARFIVLVVGWAAHAIAAEPLALFDLPIQYPAPRQLTGSEHFLTSQVVALPIFWATGNALLAANLAAFVSYPLAAFAAQLFLLELGAALVPAWIGGLLFALGPLRVPASVQILQYLNLFLPLLAWALSRLRARPTGARATAVFLVMALGGLSSYHMAAMLAVVGAAWGSIELLRPAPERARFFALAAGAATAALVAIGVVSLPYFFRPEAHDADLLGTIGIRAASPVRDTIRWFGILAPTLFGPVPLAIAAGGLVAPLLRSAGASRRMATVGVLFVLLGALLMLPPEPVRALIDGSPLRFLRAPWRFVAIAGLGTALLSTALLEVLRARLSPALAAGAMVAVAALVLGTQGRRLMVNGLDPVPALAFDRALYEAVGRIAAERDPGPLLELPVRDAVGQGVRSDIPRALTDPDAMVGATLHGQPLVTGKTGYAPAHRRMIDEMIQRLPSQDGLQEIVDATHLRWLLLRPEGFWESMPMRRALLALDGVDPVLERDGWTLAHVGRTPGRAQWYRAIAAPAPRERSPLGTPLAPLVSASAAGAVRVEGLPARVSPRALLPIEITVENTGAETWPVTAYVGTRFGVFLGVRWTRVDAPGAEPAVQAFSLPRDLSAGETSRQVHTLKTPVAPGAYDLEIRVKQWAGSPFEGAANQPFRMRVEVAGAAPSPPSADQGATPGPGGAVPPDA